MVLILLFIAGLILLFYGADMMVKASSALGVIFRIPKIVIGLTVVSICTSLPEGVLSLLAQLSGEEGNIALGNVIGSNIANIGLILGAACLICPQKISIEIRKQDSFIMLGISLLLYFVLFTGVIDRFWGITFLILLLLYFFFQVRRGIAYRRSADTVKKVENVGRKVVLNGTFLILGAIALIFGGDLFLKAATGTARVFGLSERVIGLTFVAIGSSLPELATSVIGVIKKESEIAVGNVVGSNILNILFVVGGVSTISPITFSSTLLSWDTPIMLIFTFVLCLFVWMRPFICRWQGCIFLLAFLCFLIGTLVS